MTTTPQPDPGRSARVEHRTEHSFKVTATPEQVWDAIASAEGLSKWMVPTRLDPRIDGEAVFDFGDFESTGVITDYSPPTHFAYSEPWPISADQPLPESMVEWFKSLGVSMDEVHKDLEAVDLIATEFLIEANSGGTCVVRVVTSSFGNGADWENEFFAEMADGWIKMLHKLERYLSTPQMVANAKLLGTNSDAINESASNG